MAQTPVIDLTAPANDNALAEVIDLEARRPSRIFKDGKPVWPECARVALKLLQSEHCADWLQAEEMLEDLLTIEARG
jgi:hypothetical protein